MSAADDFRSHLLLTMTDWNPVEVELALYLPCEVLWVGGGLHVMSVESENPDRHCWLGVCADPATADGPHLERRPADPLDRIDEERWVGGYGYEAGRMTDAHFVQVEAAGDDLAIAEAMRRAALHLLNAPLTQPA